MADTTDVRFSDLPPSINADEVAIDIAADPKVVYELISDVTRMGTWSPETTRAEWRGGAHGPVVGARFRGWNRVGPLRWFTDCEVVTAIPGREFAFVVTMTTVRWTYVITPTNTGCTVVERRSQDEPRRLTRITGRLLGRDRPEQLRAGMATTLERLKAAAEAGR